MIQAGSMNGRQEILLVRSCTSFSSLPSFHQEGRLLRSFLDTPSKWFFGKSFPPTAGTAQTGRRSLVFPLRLPLTTESTSSSYSLLFFDKGDSSYFVLEPLRLDACADAHARGADRRRYRSERMRDGPVTSSSYSQAGRK